MLRISSYPPHGEVLFQGFIQDFLLTTNAKRLTTFLKIRIEDLHSNIILFWGVGDVPGLPPPPWNPVFPSIWLKYVAMFANSREMSEDNKLTQMQNIYVYLLCGEVQTVLCWFWFATLFDHSLLAAGAWRAFTWTLPTSQWNQWHPWMDYKASPHWSMHGTSAVSIIRVTI